MNTTINSCFHRLRALAGLGLALTVSACSSNPDDTGTSSTGGATTGSTSSASAPTTGPGATTGETGDDTTGEPGTTSPPTTGGTTEVATSTSTSTSDPTTGDLTTGTASSSSSTGGVEGPAMSFFVSSTGSATGNLGGLEGADARCQDLADAAGAGAKTWRAYLSVEKGPDDQPVHAKDRIGTGPWYNFDLVMIAADVADLHTKDGDHELFLDEYGEMVNGQWENSPDPNEHDILTGTNLDGTVTVGKTCNDWTSEDPMVFAQVGHSDGLGPMMNDAPMYRPWHSVHENGGCHDTAPKGGAGKIYCFAID
jgi:hypothetical protein